MSLVLYYNKRIIIFIITDRQTPD